MSDSKAHNSSFAITGGRWLERVIHLRTSLTSLASRLQTSRDVCTTVRLDCTRSRRVTRLREQTWELYLGYQDLARVSRMGDFARLCEPLHSLRCLSDLLDHEEFD